jgi:prepilin-type processing-associated H-X9-DG protein
MRKVENTTGMMPIKRQNPYIQNMSFGFSLLEVLVVMTAITTLIGILVPSLGRAREQARRISCANNLQQLGFGLAMYAMANDGWYPVEELCGNPQSVLTSRLFPRYLANRDIFYCPSAAAVEPYAQSNEYGGPGGDSVIKTDDNWERSYISYKYFSITRRDTRMPLPLRLCEYPHLLKDNSPSRRWLMSDWVRKHVPVFPHLEKGGWGGGRNVLFADTSVQFVRHRTQGAF